MTEITLCASCIVSPARARPSDVQKKGDVRRMERKKLLRALEVFSCDGFTLRKLAITETHVQGELWYRDSIYQRSYEESETVKRLSCILAEDLREYMQHNVYFLLDQGRFLCFVSGD